MDATGYKFRTAIFGGFKKRDVLNYLETSAREHAEQVQSLEEEVETLRQIRAELEARCMEGEERGSALASTRDQLEDDLDAAAQALEAAKVDVQRKSRLLAEAQEEVEQLRERVKALEPAAMAYEGLKDRTASVELEAHRRAQLIEEDARTKAKDSAQEVEQWVAWVRTKYDRLCADINSTLTHAVGELERTSANLENLTGDFSKYDAALERIEERARSNSGIQPPKPLSLDRD